MLEKVRTGLRCEDGTVGLEFRPFEIKTLRLAMAETKGEPRRRGA